ncbi:MAG TPA: hypothetical protein P5081_22385 [Phycisphaerae bacterium]|nr:hypothetical protein [Phycisphaerae bacterium]HRW55630.1 hypothetical protein [Phycisphaerae bacterium]
MAKQSAGFVHEHIEKVVVAVCAGFLVFAVYVGFMSGRFTLADKSPGDLIKSVGDAADDTAGAVLSAKSKSGDAGDAGKKDAESVEKVLAWYGPAAKSLAENAGVTMEIDRTQAFPPLFVSTTSVSSDRKRNLVTFVAPDLPVVTMGVSELELPGVKPELKDVGVQGPDGIRKTSVNWVAVAAQIDLDAQARLYKDSRYPARSFPYLVKVHLERRDRDERWRGWQDVEEWLPYEPFDRMTASQSAKLLELILPKQDYIARPRLPERVGGDRIEYDKILPLLDETPKAGNSYSRYAKEWLDRANRSVKAQDYEAAMIFARAAMRVSDAPARVRDDAQTLYERALDRVGKRPGGYKASRTVAAPDRMMPILAYDFTAVPGHEYQYRIRYEVWNQYAGKDGELQDPKGASEVTVLSGWSPVTPPHRFESDLQFYLTDASEQAKKVEVTIWKRNRRTWEKQDFKLAVGDEIGKKDKSGTDFSTGAVIVDIKFNEPVNGKRDTILVYKTPDGVVREAVLSVDKQLNEDQKKRA